MRKTISVDFDGVIHRYSKGWHDGTTYDVPMPGAFEAICKMRLRGYDVVIHSARPASMIQEWLSVHWPKYPPYGEPPSIAVEKPHAVVYIDYRLG